MMTPARPFVMQLPSFGRRWLAFIDYAFEFIFMKHRAGTSRAECRRTNNECCRTNLSSAGRSVSALHSCWHPGIREGAPIRNFLYYAVARSWIFRGRPNRSTLRSEYLNSRKTRISYTHCFSHLMRGLIFVNEIRRFSIYPS